MRLLLLALVVTLLSACQTTQYLTISSDQTVKNAQKELVAENDSLRIVYHFSSSHGLLVLSVFNKSDQPLEINWRKSAFIYNGRSTSYFTPAIKVDGSVSVDSVHGILTMGKGYNGEVKGNLFMNEPVQFLPPKTSISRELQVLPRQEVGGLSFKNQQWEVLEGSKDYTFKYKKLSFASQTSPVTFRSYITFTLGGGKEFSVDHHFYVSEIWQSAYGPDYLPFQWQHKGDQFTL